MTPKHMKQRSPAMPVGAQPDLETKDLRETVRIGLASMTEQFLARRNDFLAKAMSEEGLDNKEWSVQMDDSGVRFVRPRKQTRKKLDIPQGEYDTSIKPAIEQTEGRDSREIA